MNNLKILIAFIFASHTVFATSPELKPPEKPLMENCLVNNRTDPACLVRNQKKESDYAAQLQAYNDTKRGADLQAQQAAQQAAAQQSALEAAKKAEADNKKGSQIYQLAAVVGTGVAIGCFIKGYSSPSPANMYWYAAGAVAMGLSYMAYQQSKTHDKTAQDACVAASQMSTSGSGSCGSPVQPYDGSGWPRNTGIDNLYDKNGKCIGNADQCKSIQSQLAGMNIKSTKGLSGFGSDGKMPVKMSSNGLITMPDGKTFTAESLTTEKGMLAAGMQPDMIKAMMKEVQASPIVEKKAVAVVGEKGLDVSPFGDSGSSSGGSKTAAFNGNGAYENVKTASREPASAEGLAKDFNGEQIGVAGDDIFKMMNRRYNVKTGQDAFIGP